MDVWSEIEKIPRLSKEEEKSLGVKISKGNDRARTRLVEANLWVAVPVAKALSRKSGGKWQAEDLLSEASAALMTAADRWDYESPVRFGAYCRMRVRGSMKDFLRRKADVVKGAGEQALSLDAPEGEDTERNMHERLESTPDSCTSPDPLESLSCNERELVKRRILQKGPPESFESLSRDLKVTVKHLQRLQSKVCLHLARAATGQVYES